MRFPEAAGRRSLRADARDWCSGDPAAAQVWGTARSHSPLSRRPAHVRAIDSGDMARGRAARTAGPARPRRCILRRNPRRRASGSPETLQRTLLITREFVFAAAKTLACLAGAGVPQRFGRTIESPPVVSTTRCKARPARGRAATAWQRYGNRVKIRYSPCSISPNDNRERTRKCEPTRRQPCRLRPTRQP